MSEKKREPVPRTQVQREPKTPMPQPPKPEDATKSWKKPPPERKDQLKK